jgi:hypothetical protein
VRITEKDLDIGEVICNKCEGGGSWPRLFLVEEQAQYYRCPKCRGKGKLDWIYNITGVPSIYGDLFTSPLRRNIYPLFIASEIVGVQPMNKPTEVKIWQKVDTSWRVLRPLRRLLTIFSKGKGEGGMRISPENTFPLF